MKIDGGCFCGNITFEADIDPEKVMICHCTDCQSITGSAFRVNVPVAKEHITFHGGQPKKMVKTAESGNKRARRRSVPNAARHCMGLRRWPTRHRSCCASARSGSARNCGRRCRCGAAPRSTGRWTYAPSRAFPRDRALNGRASVAAAIVRKQWRQFHVSTG